jgi:hypothetical protein
MWIISLWVQHKIDKKEEALHPTEITMTTQSGGNDLCGH